MFKKKFYEIDVGLAGVKAGIDMGKADGNEAGGAHDAGGLLHQLQGKRWPCLQPLAPSLEMRVRVT